MMRVLLVATSLLLAGCHSAPQERAGQANGAAPTGTAPLAAIRSASIELPADDETFGHGAQGDVLNRTCLACHSATMVRYQPPLTRKQWTATVDKMREAYGAPFQKSETAAIVDALVATQPFKP
jgi:cytochrome c5